ncbi:MAG TPA: PDZ domain-containing protein [Candidatus Acidoferrales bacterium]|nr:PDZ domain-containing protein [Candidatus Acidoferrales bacterium]
MNRRVAILSGAIFALIAGRSGRVGLTAQPSPHAQANAAPAQQPVAYARFAFGGNAAQIPAEFIGNLILVPAHVRQSQPLLFELDSTAAVSSIDPGRASELGIADLRAPVLNFSGVDISLSGIAKIARKDFSAQVGRPYEGTIGNDILEGVVVELDYVRQGVRLYDPAPYQYSGKGKILPLTFVGGMPVVKARVTIGGRKAPDADFIVNTALDAPVVISDKFAQAHHLISSHTRTIPATGLQLGGSDRAVFARLEEFQIGPYRVEEPLAAFSQGSLPDAGDLRIAGEIGGGMLRRFDVVFDYARRQMILDPSSDFRADDLENMSGLSIVAKGPGLKQFEIAEVRPGSPGADAGIRKGDVIAGVDEEAAADLSLVSIRDLFRQVGHKYKLLIERDGRTLPITVQMRRQL